MGIAAFFLHFYWTKIGVSEIWNTVKWSSMRSSFYRTIRRFSQGSTSKFATEPPVYNESVYSEDIDVVPYEKPKSNPMITSYMTQPTYVSQKPVSIISYNNSGQNNYATKIGQPMENTKIHGYNNNDNQYNDLASMIQKQRF